MLGIEEIKKILPHRAPMLLIDRVEELNPGVSAVAYKGVTYNEPFFKGHYPDYPVMPGVLIVEAMAQTGGVAIMSCEQFHNKLVFFAGMDHVKFRKQVTPGCLLRFETEIIKMRGSIGIGKGKAFVDDQLMVEAELTFVIK